MAAFDIEEEERPGLRKAPAPPVLVMGVPVTVALLALLGDVAITCRHEGVSIEAWLAAAWKAVGK